MASSPEALFAALVSNESSRPFVTFYDESSGERTELSVRSLGNWVAKTHFLLTDELGLGVGEPAYVDLPVHWISVPVLLGCWTAGLDVVTDPAGAAVAFVAGSPPGVADTYAVSLDSAARGFGGAPPAGASDYVSAVRPQQDAWATVHPPASSGDPALDGVSRADVVERARARAQQLDVAAGARLLTTHDNDWFDALLVPLAVGGSLVIVRNAGPDLVARRAEQERVSQVL